MRSQPSMRSLSNLSLSYRKRNVLTGKPSFGKVDLFGFNRRKDETVQAYRASLKTALRSQTTAATVKKVHIIVVILFVPHVKDANARELFHGAKAQMLLDANNEVSTVDITSSQFIVVVDAAVVTGVGFEILFTEELEVTFTPA